MVPKKLRWGFLKVWVSDFEQFCVFENLTFTSVAYGEIKKANILKTSDRRAKRSDLWVAIQHI